MGDFPAAHSHPVAEGLPENTFTSRSALCILRPTSCEFIRGVHHQHINTNLCKVCFFCFFFLELHNKSQKKRSCRGHGSHAGCWNSLRVQMEIDLMWLRHKCSRTRWCFIHVTFSHVTYFLPLTPVLFFVVVFFLSAATLLMLSAGKHELVELCCTPFHASYV